MSGSPAVWANPQRIEELIKSFQDEKTNSSAVSGDKKSRAVLLAAAKKLTAAFEAPDDALNYAQFYVSTQTIFMTQTSSTYLT